MFALPTHLYDEFIIFPAPATLNGDIINKAQFDVLQHAMKQLEVSIKVKV